MSPQPRKAHPPALPPPSSSNRRACASEAAVGGDHPTPAPAGRPVYSHGPSPSPFSSSGAACPPSGRFKVGFKPSDCSFCLAVASRAPGQGDVLLTHVERLDFLKNLAETCQKTGLRMTASPGGRRSSAGWRRGGSSRPTGRSGHRSGGAGAWVRRRSRPSCWNGWTASWGGTSRRGLEARGRRSQGRTNHWPGVAAAGVDAARVAGAAPERPSQTGPGGARAAENDPAAGWVGQPLASGKLEELCGQIPSLEEYTRERSAMRIDSSLTPQPLASSRQLFSES